MRQTGASSPSGSASGTAVHGARTRPMPSSTASAFNAVLTRQALRCTSERGWTAGRRLHVARCWTLVSSEVAVTTRATGDDPTCPRGDETVNDEQVGASSAPDHPPDPDTAESDGEHRTDGPDTTESVQRLLEIERRQRLIAEELHGIARHITSERSLDEALAAVLRA